MFILLAMPVVQIIIFGFALTNEVKNARFLVWDAAQDELSRSLTQQVDASRYFDLDRAIHRADAIQDVFKEGKVKLALVLPPRFQQELEHLHQARVQLIADASDPNVANTLTQYASSIIRDFQDRLTRERKLPYTITTETRMLYNPELQGAYNFVPGVMAMVLLLVCTMMTAITIVREKETGTLEIMLVSPMRPFRIVLAKAVPYLLLSTINIASILLLSVYVLDVPIRGSLPLLVGGSLLFTLVSLSLGLLISAAAATQQTAMFISLVGMFLPTVMLSGFMFPVENMPLPLRTVSHVIPARWYYSFVRSVMIKGVGVTAVAKELAILAFMLFFFLTLAIRKFKVRLAG